MSLITIDVTEERVREIIDNMETEIEAMENTLNSFRANDLTDTDAYRELQAERDDLQAGIDDLQDQLDDQTEVETTDEGLGELFG